MVFGISDFYVDIFFGRLDQSHFKPVERQSKLFVTVHPLF